MSKALKQARNKALKQAVDLAGGQSALARRLGTSQSRISYWVRLARKGVAAEYVLPIELATGVSRFDLRPDLYPRIEAAE